MGTLTIRNLDDELKSRLRLRAAGHNHSMEEEVRQILRSALESHDAPAAPGLASRIRSRLADVEGEELELPDRSERPREPWGLP